ncbi:MAG: hypothetical protein WBV61_09610 [Rhodanobacteraceae bacterium]
MAPNAMVGAAQTATTQNRLAKVLKETMRMTIPPVRFTFGIDATPGLTPGKRRYFWIQGAD